MNRGQGRRRGMKLHAGRRPIESVACVSDISMFNLSGGIQSCCVYCSTETTTSILASNVGLEERHLILDLSHWARCTTDPEDKHTYSRMCTGPARHAGSHARAFYTALTMWSSAQE